MEDIGLDVHKQYSVAYVFNKTTGEGYSRRLDNSRSDFEALFSHCESPRILLEACRSSYMIYDIIEDLISDIQMVNPLKVKTYAAAKTDITSAELLSTLMQVDLIPRAHIRDRDSRCAIYLLRQFRKACFLCRFGSDHILQWGENEAGQTGQKLQPSSEMGFDRSGIPCHQKKLLLKKQI